MIPLNSQIFFYLVCFGLGLGIFISGFVPDAAFNFYDSNKVIDSCLDILNNDTCQKLQENTYTRQYDRVVIVVIDALRADFIPSVSKSTFNVSLPFVENLLHKNEAISFINKVYSPTVTLPRIKTLVTGKTSNFLDIINNFNAKKLSEDSFLHQAKLKGLKSVFYGDETWLKVFPNFFLRSEGTHSFFVRDFKEVDDNVTRHLKDEFKKLDWDFMILHYLGVDHIGHGYGPYSSYLDPKLKEMDSIIEYIYNETQHYPSKSLIVICGDHGMTSDGNHGGVSKSETLTPLIFINSRKAKFNIKNNNKTVSQVDIAATLSVLMGLPIPERNTGVVILDALLYSELESRQILSALFNNVVQLYKAQNDASFSNKELQKLLLSVVDLHLKSLDIKEFKATHSVLIDRYTNILKQLKNSQCHDSSYNSLSLITGLILIWKSLIALISCLFSMKNNSLMFQILKFCMQPILIKFYTSLLISSTFLCFYTSNVNYVVVFFLVFLFIFMLSESAWLLKYFNKNFFFTLTEKSCIVLFILQMLSLFSSSFIEKEHNVWYFNTTTLLILIFIKYCLSISKMYVEAKRGNNEMTLGDFWKTFRKNCSQLYCLITILILHNLFRDYGASNIEGISFENPFNLKKYFTNYNYLLLISQIIILFIFYHRLKSRALFYIFSTGLFLVYIHQTENKFLLTILRTFHLNIIIIPWIIFMHIFLILFSSIFSLVYTSKSCFDKYEIFIENFTTAWILLTQLIGHIYLLPLTAFLLVQEILLNQVTWKSHNEIILKVSLYLQLGMYSFYLQGNTNNLSTIDVSSGYVGLSSYKPILVSILIICNTYRSLVLWLLLLYFRILNFFYKSDLKHVTQSLKINYLLLVLIIYRLFILSVYCIVMFLMKHHLFIMSVFAPKLFYEITHTSVFILCFMLFIIIQFL